jgi:hypothetical protein
MKITPRTMKTLFYQLVIKTPAVGAKLIIDKKKLLIFWFSDWYNVKTRVSCRKDRVVQWENFKSFTVKKKNPKDNRGHRVNLVK